MSNFCNKKLKNILPIFLASLLFFSSIPNVYAINSVNSGFRLNSNAQTINAHNTCRVSRTTSGSNVFAPTRTSSEWSNFISNRPSNVSLSSCEVCTGWLHGSYPHQYTWYLFRSTGSVDIRWNYNTNPNIISLGSGNYSRTSYNHGGYRYERGPVKWSTSYYTSYYVRRCR